MALITELGTFRLTLQALVENLLSEVDAARFARRASGKGLIVDDDIMILVDPETPVAADDKIIPKPLGMVTVEDYPTGGAVVLHQFYADNPSAAIILILGALARWKTLVPDSQVTPAARRMIQTFWKKYRNDPSRVTPNFVQGGVEQAAMGAISGGEDRDRWEQDYLNAAYHDGGGFPLDQFIRTGNESLRAFSERFQQSFDEVIDGLEIAIERGWKSAYTDETKTGRTAPERGSPKRG